MKISTVRLLIAAVSLAAALQSIEAVDAQGTPAIQGQIVFSSGRDEEVQIYVTNVDGTGQRQLTTSPGWNVFPAWSPDGRRIAFTTDRGNETQIWAMNAEGVDQRPLSFPPGESAVPVWSPDGRRLAFLSTQSADNRVWNLHVMLAGGAEKTRLSAGRVRVQPTWMEWSWSPDSERIVFTTLQGIFLVSVRDRRERKLADGQFPTWSPDGRRVAFVSTRGDSGQIFVMNGDGTVQTPLTASQNGNGFPAWSPDGRKIVFASNRDANDDTSQIYVMNSDGGSQTRLTSLPGLNIYPAWSPDGRMIAFFSHRDGISSIQVMNADGDGLRRLAGGVNTLRPETWPHFAWRPR